MISLCKEKWEKFQEVSALQSGPPFFSFAQFCKQNGPLIRLSCSTKLQQKGPKHFSAVRVRAGENNQEGTRAGAPSYPRTLRPTDPHTLIPHTLTPSYLHTLTPSYPHTLTPSYPHTLTPSYPHSPIPSHPHTLIPVPNNMYLCLPQQ